MKRSEMISKIENLLEVQRQDLKNVSDYADAEAILDLIEDAGMLPPEIRYWNSQKPWDVNEKGIPNDLKSDRQNGDYVNRWSKEDDT